MKHLPFIDGLRAVAILPVILFHFNLAHVTGGYVGVDVFFVISGFLITGLIYTQLREKRFSIIHFYERRARRILPALFAACFLSLLIAWALFMPKDFVQLSRSLEGIAGFVSNFIFARWTGYFADTGSTQPLLHTWSLAVEEQFYVIFPVLLYALSRYFKDKVHAIQLCIYILFIVSFALSIALLPFSPEKTFYLLHTRAWELMAGSILALHLKDLKLSVKAAELMSWTGAVILLLCFFMYDRNTPFPGLAALPPCLGTVFLLWSNINHETAVKKILVNKIAVGIGLISYGLYLYHWPVLVFSRYYFNQEPSALYAVFFLPFVFGISTLSYLYLEQPIRNGKWLNRKEVFRLSGLGLVFFALIGVAGVYTKGFPQRFDGAVLQYASATQNPYNCAEAEDLLHIGAKTVCKIGVKKERPDFLLWGDSHAYALSAAFEAQAQKRKVSGWFVAYPGCPPLVGIDRTDGLIDYSCPQISNAVLELIRREKIKTVILVSRWDMYVLGWEKGGVETAREPAISYISPDGKYLKQKEAFVAALIETFGQLKAAGVNNIWVVEQVPPQLIHPPSALALAQYLGRDMAALERPYEEIVNRRAFIGLGLLFYAYSANIIDPAIHFCPQKKPCLIADKGYSLYSDDTHLSQYGALWSQSMLEPFFNSLR